jgi:hypothetical protein
MESTWNEMSGTGSPEHWQPGFNRTSRLLRELKLDRPTRLLLYDCRSPPDVCSRVNVVQPQFDQVTGAELAVDC